jgi:hypothetical protein
MKRRKGFFSLLLAFSLPRGEGSLTYGFQAWREAKGLDFTSDQWATIVYFFRGLVDVVKSEF